MMQTRQQKIQYLKDVSVGKVNITSNENPLGKFDLSPANLCNIPLENICACLHYANYHPKENLDAIGDLLFEELFNRLKENKLSDEDAAYIEKTYTGQNEQSK